MNRCFELPNAEYSALLGFLLSAFYSQQFG
jgi:hypothetical protein